MKRRNFRKRLGRCYELAGRYVTDHHDAILVHGSIEGAGNPRIAHAWAELGDGTIYEAVLDETLATESHKAIFNPIEYARYDHETLLKTILRHKHWAPWDETSLREHPCPKQK